MDGIARRGCWWQLPHILLALAASASFGTLAASRLSAGAGALSWRLVQDSRGEDVGRPLDVVPHGGGADGDRLLRLLPLFRADDGVGKALTSQVGERWLARIHTCVRSSPPRPSLHIKLEEV